MQPRIRIKSDLPLGNKPSRISPHEVLQSWLINLVYHLISEEQIGKGGGGLLTFFPWLEGGGLFERGGLIEDLRYLK